MSFNHPKQGPNYVPAYQSSGIPFVTSSASTSEVPAPGGGGAKHPITISFPYVTKFVTLRNTGNNGLRMAFSYSGSYAPGETMSTGEAQVFDPAKGGDLARKSGRHYFIIPAAAAGKESTQTFDIRCKKLFLLGDGGTTGFSLLAGLTTIDSGQFPVLTGSHNGAVNFEGIG